MVDLEKLALQRDRGYLVRLVVLLVVGVLVSIFLFAWLTGSGTRGCVSESIGGTEQKPAAPAP
jgi:beta-lactam-binding protein with PASTA domain